MDSLDKHPFLPLPLPASFPNDVAVWATWHNSHIGVEAAAPTAQMPTRMLLVRRVIANCLVQYPMYSYVEHNPQPTHNVRQHVVT
jgi:hypothetical protein